MAVRITPEKIELINELYYLYGNKSKVAKEVGVSASTVSKYIQLNYIPKNRRQIEKTDIKIIGCQEMIELLQANVPASQFFLLSNEEWEELKEMQETEIFM